MYKLKFIKGLSYVGAVRASKKKPFVEVADEAVAASLVASGHFELISASVAGARIGDIPASEAEVKEQEAEDKNQISFDETEQGEPDTNSEPFVADGAEHDTEAVADEAELHAEIEVEHAIPSIDTLLDMTKAELTALAAARGVDISTCRNNERRAEAIYAALTAN